MPPGLITGTEVVEVFERLEALEKKKVSIKDLPIKAIREALSREPQDPNDLLLPNSVTNDLLADDLRNVLPTYAREGKVVFDFDITEITIAAQGGYVTIAHSLGIVPKTVLPVLNTGTYQINVSADTRTDVSFRLGAYRTDGPNVGTQQIGWIALGLK